MLLTILYVHRAISLMQEIVASGPDAQSALLAKGALESLFNANISAKYWVAGTLEMTNHIVNMEFHDGGPVS